MGLLVLRPAIAHCNAGSQAATSMAQVGNVGAVPQGMPPRGYTSQALQGISGGGLMRHTKASGATITQRRK